MKYFVRATAATFTAFGEGETDYQAIMLAMNSTAGKVILDAGWNPRITVCHEYSNETIASYVTDFRQYLTDIT